MQGGKNIHVIFHKTIVYQINVLKNELGKRDSVTSVHQHMNSLRSDTSLIIFPYACKECVCYFSIIYLCYLIFPLLEVNIMSFRQWKCTWKMYISKTHEKSLWNLNHELLCSHIHWSPLVLYKTSCSKWEARMAYCQAGQQPCTKYQRAGYFNLWSSVFSPWN